MKNNKAFTLIELLVVIAIVGFLTAIVFANLTNAREKSQNAAVQVTLSSLRSQADLYLSSSGGSYSGLCDDLEIQKMIDSITETNGEDTNCVVSPSGDSYTISAGEAGTISPESYCVDSSGFSGETSISQDDQTTAGTCLSTVTSGGEEGGGGIDSSYLGGVASSQSVNQQTYNNFYIGEPDPNRIILVSIGGRYGGSSWNGTSVTVGGVQATLITRTSFGFFTGVALYKASVPTGTTATIQVNQPTGTTSNITGFQAYRVVASNLTLIDSDQDSCSGYDWQCGDVATGLVTTVDTVSNGLVLALGYWRFSPNRWQSLNWAGIEENGLVYNSGSSVGAAIKASDGTPVTVTSQTNLDQSDGKRMLLISLSED